MSSGDAERGKVKVCGNCGLRNSAAKNYCDRCGTPMAPAPAPDGNRPPEPTGAGLAIPLARRMDSSGPAPAPEGIDAPLPPPTGASWTRLRRRDKRQQLYFWLPVLAALAIAAFLYYDYQKPQKALPRAAAQYLDALSRQDFPAAYGLLSREARRHCTLEEFRALRDETPWTWSNARVALLEPEAAVVQYRLSIAGRPPSDDFLAFLREDGRWTRPYNWNLLQKAEAAFARNDPDMALLVAQAAARINPRDPMARGYLCEAVYYRKAPAETERECALALSLSRVYPSKLSPKSLYHLHAILGDTYKNSLGKYTEAVAQYDALLAFPDLAAADKCDLLLARADTRIAMGQGPQAGRDLDEAAAICAKPADLDYILKRQARLAAAPSGKGEQPPSEDGGSWAAVPR